MVCVCVCAQWAGGGRAHRLAGRQAGQLCLLGPHVTHTWKPAMSDLWAHAANWDAGPLVNRQTS